MIGLSRFSNSDGVSCYMVSIVHILQYIPEFVHFLVTKEYIKYIANKNLSKYIVHELFRLIETSVINKNPIYAPKSFKKVIGLKNSIWSEMEHQDSQEFYSFIISAIEEECGNKVMYIPNIALQNDTNDMNDTNDIKYINNTNDTDDTDDDDINKYILKILANNYIHKSESQDFSPIKNLFVGYLISNIECEKCYSNSPSFESFLTLQLSIPINKKSNYNDIYRLEECLDHFIKDEKLDKLNKLYCDLCNLKNQSVKKMLIWKAPKILVIQLKRFITNAFGLQTAKILNPVIYPVNNFDIGEYMHPDSPFRTNTIYSLIGINIHKEIGFGSINAGHYISIVKRVDNQEWNLFDDDNEVEKISENSIQNRNAYLLFYSRND
jgi:ubiquitin carboxyl-terminal hydrolase 8